MSFFNSRFLFAVVVSAVALGCGDDDPAPASAPVHEVYFDGQIYDGATGARLTSYQITIDYRDQKITGEVAADSGRFLLRKLPVFQDYTVTVTADGYRPFRSHNGAFNLPNPSTFGSSAGPSTLQTFYYDAYLFPTNLTAKEVKLKVKKDSSTGEAATGKIRLRPTSASSLADTNSETPAGVPSQLWTNDEDLQAKPVLKDVANGEVTLAPGELVYGVRYLVSIYDVEGYAPLETDLTAGSDASRTLVVRPESSDPLTLVSTTAGACNRPTSTTDTQAATVTFEFSDDIELASTTIAGGFAEVVDDGISITSSNITDPLSSNTLATDLSSTSQERGTRLSVSGKTLTVTWNAATGLATKDPLDTITSVRWSLSSIEVQPLRKPSQKVSLGSVYPAASFITCN